MTSTLTHIIATVFCWIVKPPRICSGLCRYAALVTLLTPGLCMGGDVRSAVLVLGDSLSAGHDIEITEGWVHLLAERLGGSAGAHQVINASVSGETTRGGLDRLASALARHVPLVVVIELGGNDGLRGLQLGETAKNLRALVAQSLQAGARVLLVGIELPPNYGPAYTTKFREIYVELGAEFNLALVPSLLEGVALVPALMQDDGIHPRAQAQLRLLENVWPYLEPLLE